MWRNLHNLLKWFILNYLAEGRLLYLGKINTSKINMSNHDCKEIMFIERYSFSDFCCGYNMISLLDLFGNVYLYNEDEGINQIVLDNPIGSIKSTDNLLLALSSDREFLYKLTYFGNPSKFEFYEITTFLVNVNYRLNLSIMDTPNNPNLIFFCSGFEIFYIEIEKFQSDIKEKTNMFSLYKRNFDILKNKKRYIIPSESYLKKRYNVKLILI